MQFNEHVNRSSHVSIWNPTPTPRLQTTWTSTRYRQGYNNYELHEESNMQSGEMNDHELYDLSTVPSHYKPWEVLQKTVQQFSCEFHLPQTHLVPITVWIQHISSFTFRTYSTWVNSGLLTIDDQPGNPWAWKASCFTSPKTLNFSPREQLFLLYKHLAYKQNKLVQ